MLVWIIAANVTLIVSAFSPVLIDYIYAIPLIIIGLLLLVLKKFLFLSGICCALAWAVFYHNYHIETQIPSNLEKQNLIISGQVCDLPQVKTKSQKFTLCVDKLIHSAKGIEPKHFKIKKMLLSQYNQAKYVKTGEIWQLNVSLKRPHGFANRHLFSYESWLVQNSIDATGYVKNTLHTYKVKDAWHWQKIRHLLYNAITDIMGENNPYLGIVLALSIGDKNKIPIDQWQGLTATGTNHLLAISGLHIGLIAGLFFFIANVISKLLIRKGNIASIQYAAVVSLLAACGYATLAGFSLSTQRAIIMLTVYLLGIIIKRDVGSLLVFNLAAFCVLLSNPLSPHSAGFWLSFVATAILIQFAQQIKYDGHNNHHSRTQHQLLKIGNAMLTQWKLFIGLTPILIIIFGKFSLISPLVNLIAIPWIGLLVVPLVLLGVASLYVIPFFSAYIFNLAEWLLHPFIEAIGYVAQLEFNSKFIYLATPQIILLSIASFLLLLPRVTALKLLAVICLAGLIPTHNNTFKDSEYLLTVLDVGQGLAVVVRTNNYTLVYDTGAKYSEKFDAGRDMLVPFLRGEGVEKIDLLIVSHADIDHAGGLVGLLDGIEVAKIKTSQPMLLQEQVPDIEITPCTASQQWTAGGIDFEILHPARYAYYQTTNDSSCVLKITSRYGNSLLTGDITKAVEKQLLQTKDLQADLLIVPHHGSQTSSSTKFIQAVQPTYAVYAAGYLNKYRHPHHSVTKRYTQHNVIQYNSAYAGTIDFYFNADNIQIELFREKFFTPYFIKSRN